MKISNFVNHYPIFSKKNKDNMANKTSSNNLDNSSNPFCAFYNFQAVNSIAFMANKIVKYPPFYVVDKDCNILKDEEDKPIEFTSVPEVRYRLGLDHYERSCLKAILDKKAVNNIFSHEGTRYTCISKDEVSEDGELNQELVERKARELFACNKVTYPPFYVVDKDYNVVCDKQGSPIEFTSVTDVRDILELTHYEQSRANAIFNKNSLSKTFSHGSTRYTCVFKDEVSEDGELNQELVEQKAQEMFARNVENNRIYPPFFVVDKDYNVVCDKQGNPIEFTSIPQVAARMKLPKSTKSNIVRILSEKYRDKTFSREGVKYTCIFKDDIAKNGEIDEELVKSKTDKIFENGTITSYPPFYVVDTNYSVLRDEQGEPMEFTSSGEVRDGLGLAQNEQKFVNAIFNENADNKTFSHGGKRFTCILKDEVIEDGQLSQELVKRKAWEMFARNRINYPPFYIVDADCNIVKDEEGRPIEFTSTSEAGDKLGLTRQEQNNINRIFGKNTYYKTFSHEGIRYTCILKDKVSDSDGSIDNDLLKNEAEKMFNRRQRSKKR